jgi:hypothetical protein
VLPAVTTPPPAHGLSRSDTVTGVVLLSLLIALGIGVAALFRQHAGVVLLGAWLVLLGVLLIVTVLLLRRQDRGAGPRRSVEAGRWHGRPATVLREHRAEAWLAAATVGSVVLPLAGWGVLLLDDGWWAAAAVLLLGVAVLLAAFCVRWLRTRPDVGVWLTSVHLVVRDADVERWIQWTDVREVTGPSGPKNTIEVLPALPSLVHARWVDEKDRRPVEQPERLTIELRAPALTAPELADLLRGFAQPGRWRALLAPLDLDALRRAAADSAPPPHAGPEHDAFAAIRSRCLALGLVEGMEFAVDGFPTSLSSEHIDLRRQGPLFEVVYSDMGRDSVIARLATVDDAGDVFVHEVARLARGRGGGPLVDVDPVRVRWDGESPAERSERVRQGWLLRVRAQEDPEAVFFPDDWVEMRSVGDAVVAYLGHGTKPWPRRDREAAVAVLAAAGLPASGVEAVEALVEQALSMPGGSGPTPIVVLGRAVADTMRLRHGGLSVAAGDALAWSFMYQWK